MLVREREMALEQPPHIRGLGVVAGDHAIRQRGIRRSGAGHGMSLGDRSACLDEACRSYGAVPV